MANRPENTVCFEGFRIFNRDIEAFKKYVSDFKYAYIGYNGDYHGVWMVSKSNEKFHEGITLEIQADGIVIKSEFRANRPPEISTITTDWKELLKSHFQKAEEHWTLCVN